MILKIFAVRDRATDQYGTPMFLISEGQAICSFSDEVNRAAADNMLYSHPDDYDLFELGEFDTMTACFECHSPAQIAIGKMVKVREVGTNVK